MLLTLILFCLLFKGSKSHITIYGNKTADYGRDAHFGCAVDNPTGVHQITWQWIPKASGSIENLATYSERFGDQVNKPYAGKVIFTEVSLNSSSITVRNVTWADEGCYICSFNVYPNGSQRKQICPTVQGISEVRTEVVPPSSKQEEYDMDLEVGVSCFATGKPAPTIKWAFQSEATIIDQSQSATVMNHDRTFSSNSSITLRVPPDWDGYVDCVMNKGLTGQRRERINISFVDYDGKDEPVKQLSRSGIGLVISATVFVTFIIVAVLLKRKRLMSNKRSRDVVKLTSDPSHSPLEADDV